MFYVLTLAVSVLCMLGWCRPIRFCSHDHHSPQQAPGLLAQASTYYDTRVADPFCTLGMHIYTILTLLLARAPNGRHDRSV